MFQWSLFSGKEDNERNGPTICRSVVMNAYYRGLQFTKIEVYFGEATWGSECYRGIAGYR